MPKSEQEINAEKAAKPRVDLIPGSALIAGGCVQAYGRCKHGPCTWKVAGTEQSEPETHVASAARHLAEYLDDEAAVESGSGLPVLWHAFCQVAIAIDCLKRKDPSLFARQVAGLAPVLERMMAERTLPTREQLQTSGLMRFAAGAIRRRGPDPMKRFDELVAGDVWRWPGKDVDNVCMVDIAYPNDREVVILGTALRIEIPGVTTPIYYWDGELFAGCERFDAREAIRLVMAVCP